MGTAHGTPKQLARGNSGASSRQQRGASSKSPKFRGKRQEKANPADQGNKGGEKTPKKTPSLKKKDKTKKKREKNTTVPQQKDLPTICKTNWEHATKNPGP